MLQAFRTNPVLIIHVVLLAASVVVCALCGLLMARMGASLRPIYWLLGLMLLVIGPQFAARLWLSLGTAKFFAPRDAALEQLAAGGNEELRRAAAKLLFGPDADAQLVADARPMFGDAFSGAEFAHLASLPNGDSVLLARFKGGFAAEKGWIAYLRVTGLNQMQGEGDSQRGYVATRPVGDRAYVLHFQNMVGVWMGKDDAAIRARIIAGGFEIPRRAPLAKVASGILPDVEGGVSPPGNSVATNQSKELSATSSAVTPKPPGWKPGSTAGKMPAATVVAALIALNLIVVTIYFFKGAAWAGTSPATRGVALVTASELAARLEAINSLDVPFRIERGAQPNEFFATWRYADAKWIDLARAHGMKRTFRIRLTLDEKNNAVRATDYATSFDWSAGRDGASLEWKALLGIVFFQYEHQRVFGLQLDEQGRFKPELSYAYTFNLNEMKSPLITAVNRAGWNWRPTIWQGPTWLRWLTE